MNLDISYTMMSKKNGWIEENGVKIHYKDSKWHNEDGPAVICDDGEVYYYLEGYYFNPPKSDLEWLLIVKRGNYCDYED